MQVFLKKRWGKCNYARRCVTSLGTGSKQYIVVVFHTGAQRKPRNFITDRMYGTTGNQTMLQKPEHTYTYNIVTGFGTPDDPMIEVQYLKHYKQHISGYSYEAKDR